MTIRVNHTIKITDEEDGHTFHIWQGSLLNAEIKRDDSRVWVTISNKEWCLYPGEYTVIN